MQNTKDITYNVAKPWQLYVFSVHDVMLNCFLYVMGFISYLATGYYGILATTAAVIATGSRIFDAITDPVVAFIIERTDGRFGRYRPMMALGWVITSLAILGLFFFCVPSGNLAIYLLLYVVYVIGYSFMMTAHGGARSVFTNEPAQRNKLGFLMGVWSKVFYMVMGVVLSGYLMVKHGGMNLEAMQELVIIMLIASFVVLVFTIIALGDRDVPENYRSKTPASRWGEAEDLGGPAVFLASPASDFVNGHILTDTAKNNLAVWLSFINKQSLVPNNWQFFPVLVNMAFKKLVGRACGVSGNPRIGFCKRSYPLC